MAQGRQMSIAEAWDAAELPTPDTWPGLSDDEKRYREGVLNDIARRVSIDGVRQSAPSPDRGSQFLPFAALKGYDSVIEQVERETVEEYDDSRFEAGASCDFDTFTGFES